MLSKVYAAPRRDLAASVLFWIPFVKEVRGNCDTNPTFALLLVYTRQNDSRHAANKLLTRLSA